LHERGFCMSLSTEPGRASSEFQENLEILMEIPLLAGLSLEVFKVLAYLCRREIFRPGEVIFRQNEPDENAYFILSGTAVLLREDGEDHEVRKIHESEFLGGLSLLGDVKRLFTLRAETPVTCLMLSQERFRKTLERAPEMIGRLLENLVKGIQTWEEGFLNKHAMKCQDCLSGSGVSLV